MLIQIFISGIIILEFKRKLIQIAAVADVNVKKMLKADNAIVAELDSLDCYPITQMDVHLVGKV